MLAAAVATVAMGSFYADMPVEEAHAAQLDVPAKKVKTIKMTPDAVTAASTAKSDPAAAATAAVQAVATPARPHVAVKPVRTAAAATGARLNATTKVTQADVAAKLESAFAAQSAGGQSAAARATEVGLGKSDRTFASLARGAVEVPTQVAVAPTPAPRSTAKARDDDDDEVSGRSIVIRGGVNMRSAGKSGSRVIQVIPSGARVTLAPGCQHWCKVSYNGRTGYIYKSFVNGGGASKARTRKAPAVAQAAAAPRKPEAIAEKPEAAGLFGNGGIFGKPKTANSETNDN